MDFYFDINFVCFFFVVCAMVCDARDVISQRVARSKRFRCFVRVRTCLRLPAGQSLLSDTQIFRAVHLIAATFPEMLVCCGRFVVISAHYDEPLSDACVLFTTKCKDCLFVYNYYLVFGR